MELTEVKEIPLIPSDWKYKCEGLGNVILSYIGNDVSLKGKVMRVRKSIKDNVQHESHPSFFHHQKSSFYTKTKNVSSREEYVRYYVKEIISRLISKCSKHDQFVDPGEIIKVNHDFLQKVYYNIQPFRPQKIQKDSFDFDVNTQYALLIKDFTHNHYYNTTEQPTINNNTYNNNKNNTFSIEIKPKWGMICTSEFINDRNKPTKYENCRYCMHQHLKLKEGSVNSVSSFCPTNLYSTNKERVKIALINLILNPQNNMRLYINGQLKWFGDKHQNSNVNSTEMTNYYIEWLERLVIENGMKSLDEFIDKLVNCILDSKVMDTIQRMQLLDRFDIEFIYQYVYLPLKERYNNDDELLQLMLFDFEETTWLELIEKELLDLEQESCIEFICKAATKNNDKSVSPSTTTTTTSSSLTTSGGGGGGGNNGSFISKAFPHANSSKDIINYCREDEKFAWHLLRMYLISHGMKDCSIMITFDNSSNQFITEDLLSTNNNNNYYSVGIVDLDPKPVSKIPVYFKMDQQIVELYQQMVKHQF
ncbi:hypothetical protein ABK040_013426 [Willaertia magna]